MTLIVFHLEISGKDDNDEHPENILLISLTLTVFHLEISSKDDKYEHPEKNITHIINIFNSF